MQVGYSLSDALSRKFMVKKCRFYIGADNLITGPLHRTWPESALERPWSTKRTSLTLGVEPYHYRRPGPI